MSAARFASLWRIRFAYSTGSKGSESFVIAPTAEGALQKVRNTIEARNQGAVDLTCIDSVERIGQDVEIFL